MDDSTSRPGTPPAIGSTMRRSELALDLQQWTVALAQAEQEAALAAAGQARTRAQLTAARANWHLDDFLACLKSAVRCLADKDLDTPASMTVQALTLAAFALDELGATEQARILSQQALVLTRVEMLFALLPTALSCAASIESSGGELDRAEALHLEALSHARQSTGPDALQLALGNQLISWIALLRAASSRGDDALADAVRRRSRQHIAQARILKDDPALSQWRRLSLQQDLGELLGLCGQPQEAEEMLRECLDQSIEAGIAYSTQVIATALAERLEARGAYQEALALLATHVHPDSPRRGSYRRRLMATRTAQSCLKHLGIGDEVTRLSERVARDLQDWASARQEAIRCLAEAGHATVAPS